MSLSKSNIPPKQSQTISKPQDLHRLRISLSNNVANLQTEIKSQLSSTVLQNKKQVMSALGDFDESLKKSFADILFAVFVSLTQNVRESNFEALEISDWVSSSLSLFEHQIGSSLLDSTQIRDIADEFTSVWSSKFSQVTKSAKPMEEVKMQEKSNAFERNPSSQAVSKVNLFSQFKNILKKGEKEKSDGPTPINLGNERNFTYDPVKKKWIFADEEEIEEPEEDVPPPTTFKNATSEEKQSNNLLKPPENRSLIRKKAPQPTAKKNLPTFMPSKTEEVKRGVVEDLRRKIDDIFEDTVEQEFVLEGIEKVKINLRQLENLRAPVHAQSEGKSTKLTAIESELESTQESMITESNYRKILESELSSLRGSYQNTFEKEIELSDSLKELERSLSVYKNLCNAKSQLYSVTNPNQEESSWKNSKNARVEKKKMFDFEGQLQRNQLQIQELQTAAQLAETKYSQVLDHLKTGSRSNAQLRSLLEDSFKTQREQDQLIIELKKETLSFAEKFRAVSDENLLTKNENDILQANLEGAQKVIRELEVQLKEFTDKLKGHELTNTQKGRELDEYSQRLRELIAETRRLEDQLEQENKLKTEITERLRKEEKFREQLELQRDELDAYRSRVEESLNEEKAFRMQIQQEKEEIHQRIQEIVAEKEDIERRFEESSDNERRYKAHFEDLERQLKNVQQERDQKERDIRKEREKMLEELMENRSLNESTTQEKELLDKFLEEIRAENLVLEKNILALNSEVNKLRSEKQRSIETLLAFIQQIKGTSNDSQGFESIENYIMNLLRGTEEVSERHFRALGVLPKVRESLVKEFETERMRQSLHTDGLLIKLSNLEKEKELDEEQKRYFGEEVQRLKALIESIKLQNEQSQQKIRGLVQDGEQLRQENDELRRVNVELEINLQQKDARLGENLKGFHDYQQDQISTLEELKQQLHEFTNIKQEMTKLREDLEAEKGVNSNALNIHAELESQIRTLKEDNHELQQQLDQGFEQYTFLQGKTKQVLEQLKQAKEEIDRVTLEHSQTTLENEGLVHEIQRLEKIVQEPSQLKISQFENEDVQQDGEELRELRNQIISLNEKIEFLEQEIQSREGHIQSLEKRIAIQESTLLPNAENNNELLDNLQSLQSDLEEKAKEIEKFSAFKMELFDKVQQLEQENESLIINLEGVQIEKDEVLAQLRDIQIQQEINLKQLQDENFLLANSLSEEKKRQLEANNRNEEPQESETQFEEKTRELESRVHALQEENILLSQFKEERDTLLQENERLTQERDHFLQEKTGFDQEQERLFKEQDDLKTKVAELQEELARSSSSERTTNVIKGEELWEEIEKEYNGGRVVDYLISVKSKLGIERDVSAGKLISLLLREFEEAIGELSRELEEKETAVLGLSRSLEEMNEQCQKLQNNMLVLEGEHSGKEDYSSIRELYDKKSKRVEELLKELVVKNSELEDMKKLVESQPPTEVVKEGGVVQDLKDENKILREEIAKEKERLLKLTKEYENYKHKYKDNSDERGAIQHSYSQIIKNLSIQLDELKKKKGVPTAITSTKSTQTGEEESVKIIEEEHGKKSGFLSGMARFFLTDGELKKI